MGEVAATQACSQNNNQGYYLTNRKDLSPCTVTLWCEQAQARQLNKYSERKQEQVFRGILVGQEVRARDSPSPLEMERVIKCRQLKEKKQ